MWYWVRWVLGIWSSFFWNLSTLILSIILSIYDPFVHSPQVEMGNTHIVQEYSFVYYLPGMVCGLCVLMMRSVDFLLVFRDNLVGSLLLGVKNNPPFK